MSFVWIREGVDTVILKNKGGKKDVRSLIPCLLIKHFIEHCQEWQHLRGAKWKHP